MLIILFTLVTLVVIALLINLNRKDACISKEEFLSVYGDERCTRCNWLESYCQCDQERHGDYVHSSSGGGVIGTWLVCAGCDAKEVLSLNEQSHELGWVHNQCATCVTELVAHEVEPDDGDARMMVSDDDARMMEAQDTAPEKAIAGQCQCYQCMLGGGTCESVYSQEADDAIERVEARERRRSE